MAPYYLFWFGKWILGCGPMPQPTTAQGTVLAMTDDRGSATRSTDLSEYSKAWASTFSLFSVTRGLTDGLGLWCMSLTQLQARTAYIFHVKVENCEQSIAHIQLACRLFGPGQVQFDMLHSWKQQWRAQVCYLNLLPWRESARHYAESN